MQIPARLLNHCYRSSLRFGALSFLAPFLLYALQGFAVVKGLTIVAYASAIPAFFAVLCFLIASIGYSFARERQALARAGFALLGLFFYVAGAFAWFAFFSIGDM